MAVEISPRYDRAPVLRFEGPPTGVLEPLVRQRARLAEVAAGFDDAQWATPSRCDGWTVRDVLAHLVGTDQFWALSVTQALAGAPTRYLVGFDPVATPAAMVEASRHQSPSDVLASYRAGSEALADVLAGLDAEQWEVLGEAPPGHIAIHALARHALWDAWIHERDMLLPLGIQPAEEPDEVIACLEYAAALGPAFIAVTAPEGSVSATIAVDGHDPDVELVVELRDSVTARRGQTLEPAVRLTGPSVALVEALSSRGPLPCEVAPEDRWLLEGLATIFDQVG